jgi:hypothetical protein
MAMRAGVCVTIFALCLGLSGAAARAEAGLADRLDAILGAERKSLDVVPAERLVALTEARATGEDLAAGAAVAQEAPLSLGEAVGRAAPAGGAEWECLTEALYFEARGESLAGVVAVAEVILNRVDSPDYPGTVCGVVRQGGQGLYNCQFTYRCDGKSDAVHERAAWAAVGRVAAYMLSGAPRDLTDGATHYHTRAVNPSWAKRFPQTASIGYHLFYRQPVRTASN